MDLNLQKLPSTTDDRQQFLEELEQLLEDWAHIYDDLVVYNAIVRYLNKRGKCVMNISTIVQIVENG